MRHKGPGRRSLIIDDCFDTSSEDGFHTLILDFAAPVPEWVSTWESYINSLPSPSLVRCLNSYRNDTPYSPPPKRSQMARGQALITPPTSPGPIPCGSSPVPQTGTDYLPFTGVGVEGDPYVFAGNLHALPPQYGVPGWQRISFLKCFPAINDHSSSNFVEANPCLNPFYPRADGTFWDIDELDLWAYEGVVLPGGKIIVGRWWNVADPDGKRECTGPFIFWNVPGDLEDFNEYDKAEEERIRENEMMREAERIREIDEATDDQRMIEAKRGKKRMRGDEEVCECERKRKSKRTRASRGDRETI